MRVILTGAAGFIGLNTASRLSAAGHEIEALDSLEAGTDPRLRQARAAQLRTLPNVRFRTVDIADEKAVRTAFADLDGVDAIIHLAARAGVRQSSIEPVDYVRTNVLGQIVLLEAARDRFGAVPFIYASSSSVYGRDVEGPMAETLPIDRPRSIYGASKASMEMVSTAFANVHQIAIVGLRFFTVYGPWGRPDMAPVLFARAIKEGRPVTLYDRGDVSRDFTYVDDIVDGILAALATAASGRLGPEHRVYNLGAGRPQTVSSLIERLEAALGVKAVVNKAPLPATDPRITHADTRRAEEELGFRPRVSLDDGVVRFVEWLRMFDAS